MTEGADERFDAGAAAALLRQATGAAQRSLIIRRPVLYAAWGVAWLIGIGGMWLSTRGQSPYRGPSLAAAVLLGVLLLLAIAVTIAIVVRASRGVSGRSEVQGRMFGLSWAIGFCMIYAVQGALIHQHASAVVLGLFGALAPLLVTSLIYLVGAAIWLDWPMFVMGTWLAVVAAGGAFAGPVTVLLVEAVAGGGGFLLMAGWLLRGERR